MNQYRNNDNITGWLAPDGEFWGCAPYDHLNMMQADMGIMSEEELENKGWIKIYQTPNTLSWYGDTAIISQLNNLPYDYFAYKHGTPTEAQKIILSQKGILIHNEDE